MPMFEWSRYRYCTQFMNADGIAYIDEREPFRYREELDNIPYRAKQGDTWWGLATFFFPGLPRPCGMWFLLCEFQPSPVIDPTIVIKEGTLIIAPSERLVRGEAFSRQQRRFH